MNKRKVTKIHPKIRTEWDRQRVFVPNTLPSLTEQAHAAGCDLKLIMDRYVKTGELPLGNTRGTASYMDAPDQEQDFKYMQDVIAEAHSVHEKLTPEMKEKYPTVVDLINADLTPVDTSGTDGAEGSSEASKSEATTDQNTPENA